MTLAVIASQARQLEREGFFDVQLESESYNDHGGTVRRGPINLSRDIGRWAKCLADAGFISDETREEITPSQRAGTWAAGTEGAHRIVFQRLRVYSSAVHSRICARS